MHFEETDRRIFDPMADRNFRCRGNGAELVSLREEIPNAI